MAENKEVVTTKSDYTNTSMANVMDYMIKTIMKESINTAIPVIPNGEIPSLPYFRYQFGENAVICDPEVGDVGLAIFAQSDCSNLNGENTEKQPGSFRTFDMSDGFYLGGFWGKKPKNFIHLDGDSIKIVAPTKVIIDTPLVNISGDVIIDGEMTAKGIQYSTHTHGGVRSGDDSTGAPNQ